MALPIDGPLSFSMIAGELGAGTPYSLRNMSSTAGFSTPDNVSEFYGYSGGLSLISLGYNARRYFLACGSAPGGYYSDSASLYDATALYVDSSGNIPALAGWYSDGFQSRYWDGLVFSGLSTLC
jgi:hypothetical protein